MNTIATPIQLWPQIPTLPPLGEAVIVRLPTASSRQAARREVRTALRRVLASWSNFPAAQLPLHETSSGPVWKGLLGGTPLDISLSYADGEGWIGLLRGGFIGLDAMRIQALPEAEDVARHYLGPLASATIQRAPDPALAFALAWTEWEARLKCLKCELNEWSSAQANTMEKCATQTTLVSDRRIVTVATFPSPQLRLH